MLADISLKGFRHIDSRYRPPIDSIHLNIEDMITIFRDDGEELRPSHREGEWPRWFDCAAFAGLGFDYERNITATRGKGPLTILIAGQHGLDAIMVGIPGRSFFDTRLGYFDQIG